MAKIWYGNPSKSLTVVAGMKNRMTTQNRQKSNAKKMNQVNQVSQVSQVIVAESDHLTCYVISTRMFSSYLIINKLLLLAFRLPNYTY